ncbi:putative homogentisate phytyltransferase 2, chloroplastic [Porphyridium purpureum]|uniref:Putative homogentisate phytyltransferase 2, chloroplastic n=1 Tax=Porphyridium purpureum TaxID=35688 RepID=A0A5J4YL59_PORPP|nr:putative homogentisate phytyltransferase 2, chloroplastic [Porphyridium purpureum]|eukprot:POR9888..scf244_11
MHRITYVPVSHCAPAARALPTQSERCCDFSSKRVSGTAARTRIVLRRTASSAASGDLSPEQREQTVASSESTPVPSEPEIQRKRDKLASIYKFTRPHTIRGTILGAFAGCVRALMDSKAPIRMELVPRALLGVVALLTANAFIVGINQIYDVSIDRVNKPFLPMAAGKMSARTAWVFIISCLVLGLVIVRSTFSPLIFGLYVFGLVVGFLYSVPPFRLKRYPVAAALSISCARGFLLNFGVYHATRAALNVPFVWSPQITFLACFMIVFSLVIALAKDIPDIAGDKMYKVNTFATRLGAEKMSNLVTAVLLGNYVFALVFAFLARAGSIRKPVMALGHLALAIWLGNIRQELDASDSESIKRFYKNIWNLFYSEYALFLLI